MTGPSERESRQKSNDPNEEVGELGSLATTAIDLALHATQACMLANMETVQRLEEIRETILRAGNTTVSDREAKKRRPCYILTEREDRILEHICGGLTNRQIARRMGVTEKTIKNYCNTMFRKLKVHSRTEAAMMATRCGWYQSGTEAMISSSQGLTGPPECMADPSGRHDSPPDAGRPPDARP
ncbi:response regulator transcription factor [Spirillospora sp. NPDC048911]|uniref:response regulator transcription factor n=1 Tax=Spirillospora sp. NPDC048911 TaxID=3364527 RepID=UPI0037242A43